MGLERSSCFPNWFSVLLWVARRTIASVGLLASIGTNADVVEPDAALLKLTRSAAYRTHDGKWKAADKLEIGMVKSASPHRLLMSGADQFDLYVGTGKFGTSIPVACIGDFMLPWQQLQQQRANSQHSIQRVFPWNDALSTESMKAYPVYFHSGTCSLELLMTQRKRPFDSAFPGWVRFEHVPDHLIERFGAKEKLAMWGAFVQLNFSTEDDRPVSHGFFVPYEAADVVEARALAWPIFYFAVGAIAIHIGGLFVIGPGLLWILALATRPNRKAAWLGIRLFTVATFSKLGMVWIFERYRTLRHKTPEDHELISISKTKCPLALVVVLTGTWNTEATQLQVREFAVKVTKDLQADVELFVWSGRNSEADRIEAGLVLAEKLRRLGADTYPKLIFLGYSHGGNVARAAVSELGDLAEKCKVFLMGTPTLSMQRRRSTKRFRDLFHHGLALAIASAFAIIVFVVTSWILRKTGLGQEWLYLIGLPVAGMFMLALRTYVQSRHSNSFKLRRLVANRPIQSHPHLECQIAFSQDNILRAYEDLERLLQLRKEAEDHIKEGTEQGKLLTSMSDSKHGSHLVLALVAFFLLTRYWPPPVAWHVQIVVTTGACVAIAAVITQALILALSPHQAVRERLTRTVHGAAFFHLGMTQLSNVIGLNPYGYWRYSIKLGRSGGSDYVLPDSDAGYLGRWKLLKNWHSALITAPLARERIAEILRKEIY